MNPEICIDFEGRITALESDMEVVKKSSLDSGAILKALHEDMVSRRASRDLMSSIGRYFLWGMGLIGAYLGSTNGHIVLNWLKQFPSNN